MRDCVVYTSVGSKGVNAGESNNTEGTDLKYGKRSSKTQVMMMPAIIDDSLLNKSSENRTDREQHLGRLFYRHVVR